MVIERLKDHFKLERTPTHEELRGRVRQRLGGPSDSATGAELSADDARLIIAKLTGFESWTLLAKHIAE